MPAFPTVGGDVGSWGQELRNFFDVAFDLATGLPDAWVTSGGPRSHDALLWTMDPAFATVSLANTSLIPYLFRVFVPSSVTVTSMCSFPASVSGASLVAGSNRMGIYSSAGVLLGQTADVTAWTANQLVKADLAAPTAIAGGPNVWVYFALLQGAGTMPTMNRISGSGTQEINFNITASTVWRRAFQLPAVASGAALPASFVPFTGVTNVGFIDSMAAV